MKNSAMEWAIKYGEQRANSNHKDITFSLLDVDISLLERLATQEKCDVSYMVHQLIVEKYLSALEN